MYCSKVQTGLLALFPDYKLPDLKQKSTAQNSHAFLINLNQPRFTNECRRLFLPRDR